MSCDAEATLDGEITVVVRNYITGKVLGTIELIGLEPSLPVDIELTKGQPW